MSVIIETHGEDKTEWGVSFTSHNPEYQDYVECASYLDAERLHIYLSASKAREAALLEKLEAAEVKAKKILELEQRVKVLTDEIIETKSLLAASMHEHRQPEEYEAEILALNLALNQTPQQTAAQIERWHVEWMMKLPVEGFIKDFVPLVAIPPLPKDEDSPETDLEEALRRQ